VQEGNAGVYTSRAILQGNGNYDLNLDQNTTYREYTLISLPGDVAADFEEIVTEKDEGTGKVSWRGVRSQGFGGLKYLQGLDVLAEVILQANLL